MLALALAYASRWDAALDELRSTCSDHPDSTVAAIYRVGMLAFRGPMRLSSIKPGSWLNNVTHLRSRWQFCRTCSRIAGVPPQAKELIDACLDCSATSAFRAALHAAACLALGDTARAVHLIAGAVDAHCAVVPMLLRDPANTALREHPQVAPLFEVVFGGAQMA